MKIPNGSQAVIRPEKLRDYLLNIEHKRGKSKAALLLSFGYTPENWQTLENDLRQYQMSFPLFEDVILLEDLPEEELLVGDIGVVVEQHDVPDMETGYSVEFFTMSGDTVAVVVVPGSSLRRPTTEDRPMVRQEHTPGFVQPVSV
jgi:hypothetical protein